MEKKVPNDGPVAQDVVVLDEHDPLGGDQKDFNGTDDLVVHVHVAGLVSHLRSLFNLERLFLPICLELKTQVLCI